MARDSNQTSDPLNLPARRQDPSRGVVYAGWGWPMKVVLLAVLGLFLGTLGGAALGIGAGLAFVEIAQTTNFEGQNGMLVFFTFMPLGAAIGGIGGAVLFGLLALRDGAVALEREPAVHRDR